MFSRTVDVLNTHCKDKLFQCYLKSVANTGFRKITFTSKICAMFCRSLFVLLSSFFLVIVLSVLLRFTDFYYPFGIFNLSLTTSTQL